jgi:hypothetical protein
MSAVIKVEIDHAASIITYVSSFRICHAMSARTLACDANTVQAYTKHWKATVQYHRVKHLLYMMTSSENRKSDNAIARMRVPKMV